jgi:hypothetical protein
LYRLHFWLPMQAQQVQHTLLMLPMASTGLVSIVLICITKYRYTMFDVLLHSQKLQAIGISTVVLHSTSILN